MIEGEISFRPLRGADQLENAWYGSGNKRRRIGGEGNADSHDVAHSITALRDAQAPDLISLSPDTGAGHHKHAEIAAVPEKPDPVELDGKHFGIRQLVDVARLKRRVSVSPGAKAIVARHFKAVVEAVKIDKPVYGFNRGVGEHKTDEIFSAAEAEHAIDSQTGLPKSLLEKSREFNAGQLLTHLGGGLDEMDPAAVRAGMAIRLNTMLLGHSGVQPDVVKAYEAFLNHDIVPVVPSEGSVGKSDILLASHIGAALSGHPEAEVHYRGERMSSTEALRRADLKPLRLVGKDFLSILSTNALTIGRIALATHDAEHAMRTGLDVSALAHQAINGNISPFLPEAHRDTAHKAVPQAAAEFLARLKGSSLMDADSARPLQDPLTYREAAHTFAGIKTALRKAKKSVVRSLKSSDDNPSVVLDTPRPADAQTAQHSFAFEGGFAQILPTANFNAEMLAPPARDLAHSLATYAEHVQGHLQVLHDPDLTGLPACVSPVSPMNHGFSAIPNQVQSVVDAVRNEAHLIPAGTYPKAGGIENTSSNLPLLAKRLENLIPKMHELNGLLALQVKEAISLRQEKPKSKFRLSPSSQPLYEQLLQAVPPMTDRPRRLVTDVHKTINVLKGLENGGEASSAA